MQHILISSMWKSNMMIIILLNKLLCHDRLHHRYRWERRFSCFLGKSKKCNGLVNDQSREICAVARLKNCPFALRDLQYWKKNWMQTCFRIVVRTEDQSAWLIISSKQTKISSYLLRLQSFGVGIFVWQVHVFVSLHLLCSISGTGPKFLFAVITSVYVQIGLQHRLQPHCLSCILPYQKWETTLAVKPVQTCFVSFKQHLGRNLATLPSRKAQRRWQTSR